MLRAYAVALGARQPDLYARLALATLRGLELEALARPSSRPTHDDLAAVFRALLDAVGGSRRRGARR
jgi:hypothetical protein